MQRRVRTRIASADLPSSLSEALALLEKGQVIALPTDTVYGVAADGFNPIAVAGLYKVKDRPQDKPIPLLLGAAEGLAQVSQQVPYAALKLAERFWPGALTLVVPAKDIVPLVLRANRPSVAVRVPDHSVPRSLALALGRPLAATSANLSGGQDASTADQVLAALRGRIPMILDGGTVGGGVPSTVVDFMVDPPRVLRAGALTVQEINRVLGFGLDC